jgi:hypothetical protein
MNYQKIILYNIIDNRILKRCFVVKENDTFEKDDVSGRCKICLNNAYRSGHNGDWEDDYFTGYDTFENAKKAFKEQVTKKFKSQIEYIDGLEEKSIDFP